MLHSARPELRCHAVASLQTVLRKACELVEQMGGIPYEMLRPYPSILFGLETAFAQVDAQGSTALSDTPFARGEEGIPVNGLVWMGSFEEMYARLEEKMKQGFRCVKLKIGAIDFPRELELVKHVREHFSKEQIELRVDANGGFAPENAMQRMKELAKYDVHSIEQPVKQHQWRRWRFSARNRRCPSRLTRSSLA